MADPVALPPDPSGSPGLCQDFAERFLEWRLVAVSTRGSSRTPVVQPGTLRFILLAALAEDVLE